MISVQVGDTKRDIVFHGDVMNTVARLEQATRELHQRFLVSVDAVRCLASVDGYALEPLGFEVLRRRASPIQVYAVAATR